MEDRLLARIGPTGGGDVRAACKKCGYPGHLTYQCRNFVKVSPIYSEDQKCFLSFWYFNNLCFTCLHVSKCNTYITVPYSHCQTSCPRNCKVVKVGSRYARIFNICGCLCYQTLAYVKKWTYMDTHTRRWSPFFLLMNCFCHPYR